MQRNTINPWVFGLLCLHNFYSLVNKSYHGGGGILVTLFKSVTVVSTQSEEHLVQLTAFLGGV